MGFQSSTSSRRSDAFPSSSSQTPLLLPFTVIPPRTSTTCLKSACGSHPLPSKARNARCEADISFVLLGCKTDIPRVDSMSWHRNGRSITMTLSKQDRLLCQKIARYVNTESLSARYQICVRSTCQPDASAQRQITISPICEHVVHIKFPVAIPRGYTPW